MSTITRSTDSPRSRHGVELPKCYRRSKRRLEDMLPGLRLLCCIQRNPWRGEHCPGMSAALDRRSSRHERPPERHTNIDYLVDFLSPGYGLPTPFKYAVGSIARACMPGNADPPTWETVETMGFIERVIMEGMDWETLDARWAQFRAWYGPSLRCAGRCAGDADLVRDLLRVICRAPEVADVELDFGKLASDVWWRQRELLRRQLA
jgi:hypothetical protein